MFWPRLVGISHRRIRRPESAPKNRGILGWISEPRRRSQPILGARLAILSMRTEDGSLIAPMEAAFAPEAPHD